MPHSPLSSIWAEPLQACISHDPFRIQASPDFAITFAPQVAIPLFPRAEAGDLGWLGIRPNDPILKLCGEGQQTVVSVRRDSIAAVFSEDAGTLAGA